jgi:hypothetical protein
LSKCIRYSFVVACHRNSAWGVRDTDKLEKLAKKNGLSFEGMVSVAVYH